MKEENSDSKEIRTLDLRGQICPSTLLVSLKAINENRTDLKEGKLELHILTDNRDSITTIPSTAKNMGYVCSVEKTTEGYYRIVVKQSG